MEHDPLRCQEIHRVSDEKSGLDAWIVLHSTALGPAFGGLRFANYASDDAALRDACGLAEAMTWKCAAAEFPGGGGKGVIQADRLRERGRALDVLGDFIEQLRGRFRTAGDIGATDGDLRRIRTRTTSMADLDALGDLGDAVAIGLIATMRALAPRVRESGANDLRGLRVAVQGLGAVGMATVRRLCAEGAHVVVADVDAERAAVASALGDVRVVAPDAIVGADVDVFAPCAIGGVIDGSTARTLRARAVVGGANRVLADDAAGVELARRGVLYAPDFLVNAGAVIRGAWHALRGRAGTDAEIAAIATRVVSCIDEAERSGTTPEAIGFERALARVRAAS
ncbi:MAG: Glu/Leu/Phe/Val dehydrogenase [Planctomycetes bacterium]|nr:Glu/Leu/Phe/Val dehydrogenase [Planctomycetota bacterium]MCC7172193.1 Glu/Leu/Phe/Val dehydrogenase [Planctomycetota bacterium]